MRKSAKLRTLQQEADSAWQRYSEASAELQKAQWLDVEHQQMLWRRGASCNMELLRGKGIAPPKEEESK